MKKVLSLILGISMLLTVVTCSVSAKASVPEIKDGTILEMEAYGGVENKDYFAFSGSTSYPYGSTVEDAGFSGGAVLSIAERNGATGMVFTAPVTVTQPGWYDLTVDGTHSGNGVNMSLYSIAIGNESVNIVNGTENLYRPANGEAVDTACNASLFYYPNKRSTHRIFLSAGTQNLVINATATTSIPGVKLVLDCLRFEKADVVSAEIEAETVLEMENYAGSENRAYFVFKSNDPNFPAHPYGSLVEDAGFSGGAVLSIAERNGATGMTFTIPVTVTEAGLYDLTVDGTHGGDGSNLSLYTIAVGDESVAVTSGSEALYRPASGTAVDTACNASLFYYPNYRSTHRIYLEAGEQRLVVQAGATTNSPGVKLVLDCLKFHKIDLAVSEIKNGTVLEMETFAGAGKKDHFTFSGSTSYPYGSLVEDAGFSGGAVLSIAERNGATGMTFVAPVIVEESGWYDLTVDGTHGDNGANMSLYNIAVGEKSVDIVRGTENLYRPASGTAVDTACNASLFYYPNMRSVHRIYLTAGEQRLVITAKATTNNPTGVKLVLDCLKFDKVVLPEVSTAGTTTLEMEDYINQIRYTFQDGKSNSAVKKTDTLASGGAFMDMSEKGGIKGIEFDLPITVKESGWYDLNLIANNSNAYSTSILYIKDGVRELANNNTANAGSELLFLGSKTTDATLQYYGMYDHISRLYLEAGDYNLVAVASHIQVGADAGNYATKFVADCLKISPVEKVAALDPETKTISVTANYAEEVSGTFLVVAYNGNQMVGIQPYEYMDIDTFNGSVTYTGDVAPTQVKVFLWEDLTGIHPIGGVNTFKVK